MNINPVLERSLSLRASILRYIPQGHINTTFLAAYNEDGKSVGIGLKRNYTV